MATASLGTAIFFLGTARGEKSLNSLLAFLILLAGSLLFSHPGLENRQGRFFELDGYADKRHFFL